MAANKKNKHQCPKISPAFATKVTSPGLTPGMTDEQAKAMAMARTRLYASSPIIRQMPRNTIGEAKAKNGKKG